MYYVYDRKGQIVFLITFLEINVSKLFQPLSTILHNLFQNSPNGDG